MTKWNQIIRRFWIALGVDAPASQNRDDRETGGEEIRQRLEEMNWRNRPSPPADPACQPTETADHKSPD